MIHGRCAKGHCYPQIESSLQKFIQAGSGKG